MLPFLINGYTILCTPFEFNSWHAEHTPGFRERWHQQSNNESAAQGYGVGRYNGD